MPQWREEILLERHEDEARFYDKYVCSLSHDWSIILSNESIQKPPHRLKLKESPRLFSRTLKFRRFSGWRWCYFLILLESSQNIAAVSCNSTLWASLISGYPILARNETPLSLKQTENFIFVNFRYLLTAKLVLTNPVLFSSPLKIAGYLLP